MKTKASSSERTSAPKESPAVVPVERVPEKPALVAAPEPVPDESSLPTPDLELDNEAIQHMCGLDNIIKELGMDSSEELINESKFFTSCAHLSDLLNTLAAPEECELSWSDICQKVERFQLAIEEEFGAFWIEALDADFDGLEYGGRRHNINVCIIALQLAAALKYKAADRIGIAAAALFYDVGTPIDSNKTYSPQEAGGLIDRSVNILRKTGAPADALRAVSECSERTDGSGIPHQLQGTQISLKGQLIGMTIAFEQLFCQEQTRFKEQGTAFQPVMQMLKEHRHHFNPQVLKSLLLTSGFYQVGAIVELNSGSLARVITQNPGAPLRPLIEVVLDRAGNHPTHRQIIDLRDNLTLSIVRTVARGT